MRQRDAAAGAGRSKLLALQERSRHGVGVQAELGGRPPREISEQARLVRRPHVDHDVGRAKEMVNLHGEQLSNTIARAPGAFEIEADAAEVQSGARRR
jgi:hypothetical protein